MHPNKIFRNKSDEKNIEFARKRSFGTLICCDNDEIFTSNIPFSINQDGNQVEAHLVRSNPILKYLDTPRRLHLNINGGDTYISPDWYGAPDQVPTWNYVSVEIKGVAQRLPQEELRGVLERLSADMEKRLLPKKPWTIDKMTPEVFEKMSRMIVPIKMDITDIDGTWKLSQNKPDEVRQGAIKGLIGSHDEAAQIGTEIETIIALMREV